MTGLGTMVNCAAIIGGCAVGLILRKGFPEKWQETIMYGVALCIFLIGLEMAQKSQNVILVIASIVIGSRLRELLAGPLFLQACFSVSEPWRLWAVLKTV